MDQLVLDELPDDPRHLIAVHLATTVPLTFLIFCIRKLLHRVSAKAPPSLHSGAARRKRLPARRSGQQSPRHRHDFSAPLRAGHAAAATAQGACPGGGRGGPPAVSPPRAAAREGRPGSLATSRKGAPPCSRLTVHARERDRPHLRARRGECRQRPLILFLHGFPESLGGWEGRSCPPSPTGFMRWRRTSRATPFQASPLASRAYRSKQLPRDVASPWQIGLSAGSPLQIVAHAAAPSVARDRDRRPQACGKAGGAQRRAHPGPFRRAWWRLKGPTRAASAYVMSAAPPTPGRGRDCRPIAAKSSSAC